MSKSPKHKTGNAKNIDISTPMKPFADPVMEAIFVDKDVAGLAARSFINAVLAESNDPLIGEITLLTPQKTMADPLGRGYRFDIEARVNDREFVDIEIQFSKMNMNERGMLYGGRYLEENAKRGDEIEVVLKKVPRVIIINVLHFIWRENHDDFHQPIDLTYRKPGIQGQHERASDRLTIFNVEIPKFERHVLPSLKNSNFSPETPILHYWLWALCEAQNKEIGIKDVISMNDALKEFAESDPGFQQYADRYEKISDDLHVRKMYAIWTGGLGALVNKSIKDVVTAVMKWHVPLNEAMAEMELDEQYRDYVIAELKEQNVDFTE